MKLPKRAEVEYDPNSFARDGSGLNVALTSEASRVPAVGEQVRVVQRDEDEGVDLVGLALVKHVDEAHGLIYFAVDLASFYVTGPRITELLSSVADRSSQRNTWTLRAPMATDHTRIQSQNNAGAVLGA